MIPAQSIKHENKSNEENSGFQNLSEIKQKLEKIILNHLSKFFEDKYFEAGDNKDKSEWMTTICNKIIETANQQSNGFKFVCEGFLIQKGSAQCTLDTSCFWDKKTDGVIAVPYEREYFTAFIYMYIIAP